MQTLTLSTQELLAPPDAPQAVNDRLDAEIVKKEGVFKLDFFYKGKAPDQQIDLRIEIRVDRFSPPSIWVARFKTLTTGKEQVLFSSNLFHPTFRNGSALISYTATINEIVQPSGTLQLSIVDTP